jgi:hypothetical protein
VDRIAASTKSRLLVGIDGYVGVDWDLLAQELVSGLSRAAIETRTVDTRTAMKSGPQIERLIAPFLPAGEPVFGRIFRGGLEDLFQTAKLGALRRELQNFARDPRNRGKALLCYGPGALLAPLAGLYDLAVYVDLTREQALKRNRAWSVRESKTQSVSPRRIYYVEFPVHDRHRKRVLSRADLYVDGNDGGTPKVLPVAHLRSIVASLAGQPLRFKPLYEPGVWGGQWLKRNRRLPPSMPNCAYGYEIIAPEQSLLAKVGRLPIELPFNLFASIARDRLISEQAWKRFGGQFPIRFSYDDTWEGGNLSIQVHPTSAYMRRTFDERMHQAEMYYILAAKPGSIVHLGLKEGVEREAFRRQTEASEATRRPFDHTRFVSAVPARKGQILLIPPGTVHGAGAGELVLEISSNPYRYTFKIYDYCRPDLDGSFRPVHIRHAFQVIKFFRNERWVADNLVPAPRLLKTGSHRGESWREYVIADRREFHHVVHRIEFARCYRDDTNGRFHILNLVGGRMVRVRALRDPHCERHMAFSETLLIPRSLGEYEVINEEAGPCQVVKSFLRHE